MHSNKLTFLTSGTIAINYALFIPYFCENKIIFEVKQSFMDLNFHLRRNVNKLSIEYKSHQKSRKIKEFELKIYICCNHPHYSRNKS